MKTQKLITIIAAATLGLAATTITALAVPAVAKSAVNVRSGPAISYAKVDALHAGQAVNVTECQSGWCYVEKPGPDGWVSGNYLQATSSAPAPSSAANDAAAAAAINIFGSIAGAIISGATPPPPPAPIPQICFFSLQNYLGDSLCVNAGTDKPVLAGFWNNVIASVTVPIGSSATVCRNTMYGGACRTYNADRSKLHNAVRNKVSSFQTF